MGKIIREKQQWLDKLNAANGRKGLMLLIKPDENASYQNVMDALDEVLINNVKKYAIVDLSDSEKEFLSAHK